MLNKKAMEFYTNTRCLSSQLHSFSNKVEHKYAALLLLTGCNASGDKDAVNASESSNKKGNLILKSESKKLITGSIFKYLPTQW